MLELIELWKDRAKLVSGVSLPRVLDTRLTNSYEKDKADGAHISKG